MLKGGTSVYYLENLYNNERNGVFLVSYQIEESPGRKLLETGSYEFNNSKEKQIRAQVKQFNFSSHSDRPMLTNFIQSINFAKDAKIFCMHGEEESCNKFAEFISEELSMQAFSPKVGDIFN